MTTSAARSPDATIDVLWATTTTAFTFVLVVSTWVAFLGWRAGAFVAVAAVAGEVVTSVALALAKYRRTMAREWPSVRPLPYDDD
jgi:hypothetical protein